jgi:HK97 family phage major capsid protein
MRIFDMTINRTAALLMAVAAAFIIAAILLPLDLSPAFSQMHSFADLHSFADPLLPLTLFTCPALPLPAAGAVTLKTLQEKRGALVAELQTMIDAAEGENRDFTVEEQTAYDAKKAELDGLVKRIDRLAGLAETTAALDQVVPAAARRAGIVRPGGPEATREFESLGQFMYAVRFNPQDQRLQFVEGVGAAEAGGELRSEMRMDTGAAGGFAVPPQFRSEIMLVKPQDALVRPRAQVIPAGDPPDAGVTLPALDQSGTNPANMFGGVQVNWIAEGAEKPESDADLTEITLVPQEVAGILTVTDKLLRNWQAADAFLKNLLRGATTAAEDYAFYRGDGVAKPLGALNSGAVYKVNRATVNTVKYLDLVNMLARLLMRGGTPVWSMSQSILPQIATLKDENNNYIWQANARDGFAGSLLGYPVRWNNRAPVLGSYGDVLLADWSYYLIKDGSGPFVAASEHVKFTQNKTVIKVFWNVDGSPWLQAPIKEENGYQVSPFVALEVPA